MTSNEQAEKKLPTLQELGSLITQRVKTADEILMSGIALPEGHGWTDEDGRLSWWMGCPVKSSNAGVSLSIFRLPIRGISGDALHGDRATIRAEIRLFMPEAQYRDGKKVCKYRVHSGDRFSAHLWVQTGPHWAFQSTSHLLDNEPFVYAQTVEALCAEIVARMNISLARATQWISEQNVEMMEVACA
jgi:hypothetical protein